MTQQVQYIFTHFIYTHYYVFQYIQKNHNLKVPWKKNFARKVAFAQFLELWFATARILISSRQISFHVIESHESLNIYIPYTYNLWRHAIILFCIMFTRDETLFSCFLFSKGILNINKIHNPFSRQNILIGIWNI